MAVDRILHYELLEVIGRGGMGVVHRAHDTRLDRIVALKRLSRDRLADPENRRRFETEAKAAGSIDHPNVCPVYDFGEAEDGRLFLVMAYCEGQSLKEILADSPRAVPEALAIISQVAAGMAAAHRKGVIHRDLKPGNLMVGPDGTLRILDFGLARISHTSTFTRAGTTMGTYAYMSPEQARGDRSDSRSDVYSMGVILYEMIARRLPYESETDPGMIHKIIHDDPPHLRTIDPAVPPEVQDLVELAMAKDPAVRFPDAGAFGKAVVRLQERLYGSGLNTRDTTWLDTTIRRFKTHHRVRWAVLSGLSLLAILGFLFGPAAYARVLAWIRGPAPPSMGIAVASFIDPGEPGSHLAAGLAEHVTTRLEAGTPPDSTIWVEPAAWVRAKNPEDDAAVRGRLGVEYLVTVRPARHGDSTEVELGLERVATGEVLFQDTIRLGEGDLPPYGDLLSALPGHVRFSGRRSSPWASPRVLLSYLQGLGLLVTGDPASAVAELDRTVHLDPGFAGARAALAAARWRQAAGDGASPLAVQAISDAEAALDLDGSMMPAHLTLGRIALARGEIPEAIRRLRDALDLDPGAPEVREALAQAYYEAEQPSTALEVITGGIEAAPGSPDLFELRGKHHYRHAEFREAIRDYAAAAARAPGSSTAFTYLGACFHALGCWDDATAMFERSFSIDRNFWACSNLATLYYYDHQFEEARQMYDWTLEFNPGDHECLGGLGATYLWLGDHAKAREYYESAVDAWNAAPPSITDEYYPYYLAKLAGYQVMLDPERARELNQEALDLSPEDSSVLYAVAENWEALGEREKALRELGAYLKLSPDDPTIEAEPYFQDLVKDRRYELLKRGLDTEPADCPGIPPALAGFAEARR